LRGQGIGNGAEVLENGCEKGRSKIVKCGEKQSVSFEKRNSAWYAQT
jgi:hypothetical protein